MNSTLTDAEQPIYQQLVHEHGDVVAAARASADETQREAGRLLHWSGERSGQDDRRQA